MTEFERKEVFYKCINCCTVVVRLYDVDPAPATCGCCFLYETTFPLPYTDLNLE
jgi:hypothetical protein